LEDIGDQFIDSEGNAVQQALGRAESGQPPGACQQELRGLCTERTVQTTTSFFLVFRLSGEKI